MATTAGGGFAAGLRAGGGLVSQALENERLDAAEARAAEDYKQKVADRERTNKAWDDYGAAVAPKATGTGLQTLQDTYGMTPQQAAAPDALAKARSYDVPDSSDLQNVPARAGGLPTGSPVAPAAAAAAGPAASPFATTADQVQQRAPGRMEQEQAMMGLSTKLRDVQGIRASQQEQRKIQFDDTLSSAMKEKMDVVRDGLAGMNTNMSAYPLLMGVKGKNGYTTLTTIDDKSGKPTGEYKFTDPQLRQIYAAQKLAEGGFGEQAMKMLTDVDKSLGEHFKNWNDATYKGATVSNAAVHNANADAQDAARTGIARANAERQANADKISNSKYFIDPKTGENYITIPTTGKNGISVQTFQLNNDGSTGKPVPLPPGAQPVGAKGAKIGPDKEAPAEGSVQVREDGTTYRADGRGGEMHLEGVLPSMREGTLAKMGFSKDEIASLPFNADGVHVEYNGQGYSVKSKADMKQLRTDIDWAEHNRIKGEEETRAINNAVPSAERTSAMQSRVGVQQGLPMFPDPNAPQRPNW